MAKPAGGTNRVTPEFHARVHCHHCGRSNLRESLSGPVPPAGAANKRKTRGASSAGWGKSIDYPGRIAIKYRAYAQCSLKYEKLREDDSSAEFAFGSGAGREGRFSFQKEQRLSHAAPRMPR